MSCVSCDRYPWLSRTGVLDVVHQPVPVQGDTASQHPHTTKHTCDINKVKARCGFVRCWAGCAVIMRVTLRNQNDLPAVTMQTTFMVEKRPRQP
jgi:hypothetical protein